jgi:calcineurin-like phosphoesterase family protein
MRYWTSDLHFGHYNVIQYCKRPYSDVLTMNTALIENWNKTLTVDDTIVFLGDWSMHPKYHWILKRLNFSKLDWVLGNHDHENKLRKKLLDPASEIHYLKDKIEIHHELTVDIAGQQFHCVHRPIQGSDTLPVLCGHVHEKWAFLPTKSTIMEHSRSPQAKADRDKTKITKTPILNVGCDVHNYHPISDAQVLEYFK